MIPTAYLGNDTLYIHIYPTLENSDKLTLPVVSSRLSKYVRKASKNERLLLGFGTSKGSNGNDNITSSIPRIVEIGAVSEHRLFDLQKALKVSSLRRSLIMTKSVKYEPMCDMKGKEITYMLPLHLNSMVSPRDEYIPLIDPGNDNPITITIRHKPISFLLWRIQNEMDAVLDMMESKFKFDSYDIDSMKITMGSTGLALLTVTYMVSVLHIIFEMLAISSDIKFWRQQDDQNLTSLSTNSYILETVSTVIITLYLYDTVESRIILWLSVVRMLSDLWKVQKLLSARAKRRTDDNAPIDEIEAFEWKCMRWSWGIKSLAVCAYTGGFVSMTPQLFRNYKLQSVSHLPWATLTYQAINTFIDDLFAFLIRMPKIHQMSVFRDDIVFIIYVIQLWMYRKRDKDKQE
eukprot:GHVO01050917.1.p1 GENE.GHVO01050917.1~~GHVO01050917.1.p1  ORF type:complete len:464 (+),score=43.40 GHVO01050917.1:182-1393(+)